MKSGYRCQTGERGGPEQLDTPIDAQKYAAVVGGGDVSELLLPLVGGASLIVAADKGAEFLAAYGVKPHILVGDFDSCSVAVVEHFRGRGCRVVTLPVKKDLTDTEAALDIVEGEGYSSVVVAGALGGERVEHEIANLSLVERYAKQGLDVILASPLTTVSHVSGPGYAGINKRVVSGEAGDWVSLFPVTPSVGGVTTCSLEFPLSDATLVRGSTLGVSNRMITGKASVSVTEGFLTIVHTKG